MFAPQAANNDPVDSFAPQAAKESTGSLTVIAEQCMFTFGHCRAAHVSFGSSTRDHNSTAANMQLYCNVELLGCDRCTSTDIQQVRYSSLFNDNLVIQ